MLYPNVYKGLASKCSVFMITMDCKNCSEDAKSKKMPNNYELKCTIYVQLLQYFLSKVAIIVTVVVEVV